ncbi:zinc finger protein 665 isoform X2 [Salmo trutta]|uniref:zinc finger protein 665 isoform X2 n=1 Tax=Salmo trutta TaxID=8032 RepID=UPI00112FDFD0|nr:zinc finger protein 665-like isoform X2 [Salmo trutta]
METRIHGGKGPPLPLPSLRLMVPPLRLVSAAIWQTIQLRHVMDYGMLEEFVTMVTEMVPELLNLRQRAQLILGLRARLVLELCRSKPITDLQTIQPHLDRIQTLTPLWGTQATDAEVGLSESNFLGLVQTLLKDPDERNHFFQDIFPVEFGPSYDTAIQNLMWQFLSRLEKLLPMSNFQQASSLLGDVPSVLEECVESVSHPQQLKTLLQYHRDLGQLDNHDPPSSTDGDCILSALCLPPGEWVVIATEVEKEGKSMGVKEREERVDSRTGECEKNKRSSVSDEEAEDDAEFADQVAERDPEYETVMVIGEDGIEKPFKLLKKHPQKKGETHGEKCRITVKPGQKISIGVSEAIMSSMIQKPSVDLQGVVIANVTQAPKSSQKVGRAKRSLERRTCKVCGKVVQRPAVLRKHMVTHTGDWPYRCPTCKKIYKTLRSFQKHIERCVFPIEETPKDSELSSTNATESSSPEPSAPIGSSKRCARCPICHKFILGYLRYHILSHSDERPHACPRCGSKYKFDFVLRRHMRLFCKVKKGEPVELGEKKVHKCNECGKEFGLKSTLTAHKRIHNPLRCAYCRRMFPDQETLAVHKVEHKPVQCTMCEKSFNVIRYLSRHYVDDHQFSGPFRCTYCERSYADLAALIRHQRIHTGGEPPYKCSHCPKKFHFETALVTHQRNHTGEKPCLCWECGKTFQSKGILKSHMNRVHTPQVKRIPCSQCTKVFRDKGQMKMHENVYHKGLRYPCSYCGKGFYSPAPLARHVLIHTGENPYSCTYKECTRVFKSASELRIHMRYHTGERPFKCKDCGKGFVQAHYLTIHRRSHTGEKPYPCLTCDKSFGTSHQLSRHMKTHTGEKPYQCMDCGKAFNRGDRLRTHQDKCHPAY